MANNQRDKALSTTLSVAKQSLQVAHNLATWTISTASDREAAARDLRKLKGYLDDAIEDLENWDEPAT